MRTKALLGLAVLAAGLATSMAQNVYSLNVVGYVNQTVAPNKFYLLGNPLANTSVGNNVTNIIKLDDTWEGTTVFTYAAGSLTPVETYFAGFGWYPGETVLNPGQGFYLFSAKAGTVTFVGDVKTGMTNALASGYNLVASTYPAAMSLKDAGLWSGNEGDTVYRYSAATANFDLITYFPGYGWYDNDPAVTDGGPTNGPTLAVGEGIYYYNAAAPTVTWTQNFTIP